MNDVRSDAGRRCAALALAGALGSACRSGSGGSGELTDRRAARRSSPARWSSPAPGVTAASIDIVDDAGRLLVGCGGQTEGSSRCVVAAGE
jgi:hypothetical protein